MHPRLPTPYLFSLPIFVLCAKETMANETPPAKKAKMKEETPSILERHYLELIHDEGVQHVEPGEQHQNDGN
jgi:hypothetical protein